MNFLPPVASSIARVHRGYGGIAVNADGTLVASVDMNRVNIYSAVDRAAHPVVVGTYGQLKHPRFACFVHRSGVDTLLVCDMGNDRVVEVTASGVFLRAIAVEKGSAPWGVAYCGTSDVIAVSLFKARAVVLLQYESGAVKPEVTIGSGTMGTADGESDCPMGVACTADGRFILVADAFNHRISKFSATSGAFVAHVRSNGKIPRDVLQCEGGSILVAEGRHVTHVSVREDGSTVDKSFEFGSAIPISLCYSTLFEGVVVKCDDGAVFVLRDAWYRSLRCAWLCATTCL
jgi:DNA-binding beta-propeller fold protein YncE